MYKILATAENDGLAQDELRETSFKIPFEYKETQQSYTIYHRDIVRYIRFLLGHRPFADKLVYTLVRQYTADGARIYSEIYTTN